MQPDFIVVGGDISNGVNIVKHLQGMAKAWDVPIYFVLGNHDYYSDSRFRPMKMAKVKKQVAGAVKNLPNMEWLDQHGVVKLTDKTALVGSGLWCDWRAGFKDKSTVWLNDYILIDDLVSHPYKESERQKLMRKVQKLAADHTDQLMKHFQEALDQGFENIIVVTHVPPFHEGSFYNGVVQDDDWAPHFVCTVAGDQLKAAAQKNPDVKVKVLCGHTHGQGKADILPNLHVINGPAKYRNPTAQPAILVE